MSASTKSQPAGITVQFHIEKENGSLLMQMERRKALMEPGI